MRGSNYRALTGKIFVLWRDGRLQERWGHTWRFNRRSFSLDDNINQIYLLGPVYIEVGDSRKVR